MTFGSSALLTSKTLHWFFSSPGLLQPSPKTPSSALVSDDELRALGQTPIDIQKLSASLEYSQTSRRLGRYLETMTAFAVQETLKPERIETGVPIRSGKRTVGELDLLFASPQAFDEHWELSVKFYICLRNGSNQLNQFMGTFVEDRLDLKLNHLFLDQLSLPAKPEAQVELAARGWLKPFRSRALMKGLFFYPAKDDAWRSPTLRLPPEISPRHDRGWWTTSDELAIPVTSSGRFICLDHLQWLTRFEGPSQETFSREDLKSFCRKHFDVNQPILGSELRRRELTVAEVIERDGSLIEVARGHFVHGGWPALAEEASLRSAEELAESKRVYSKARPN